MEDTASREDYIHTLRKEIDAVIKEVDDTKRFFLDKGGRETSIAYTKLQEAKMWLGKALGALGSELPAQYADKAE